ncbi:GNAT family N-acetyltransferase [Phytomonospora endophytica]|uniref:Putative acetyltransferase n=1 Tax=Phytomonospora endophytica TaxID=714109 RepID=A0A841FQ94_9ACTN|nr:GNAT family N-acetyltransferase [Phytomonospora endophytica]MBB6034130.1 putative acetyltransferase [Phytomonospora endophytica]GIG66522.1 UPF0256 protein [Phytomonospora endophytica]
MTDPYPLRPVIDAEFTPWARMIADTYSVDRTDAELAQQRAATDLTRTIGAFDGDLPVGGASIYPRLLAVPGAIMPVVGVATVGVGPTHRRRGILTSMMRAQLTGLYESGAESLAVLRPAEAAIYGRYGYGAASRGNRLRCDKRGMVFKPGTDFGDGTVEQLDRDAARPLLEKVYDRVWPGRAGWADRSETLWNGRLFDEPGTRDGATSLRFAVHREPGGEVTGYVLFRRANAVDALGEFAGTVRVQELAAESPTAYAALWRFLAGIDVLPWIEYEGALDEALPELLVDPRAARSTVVDRLWVRLVDVDRALAGRRYATPLDVVLDVDDAFCPWNTGRHRLRADGGTVTCERTTAEAGLALTATELGSVFLGGTTLSALAATGRVRELRPGALSAASLAFRSEREPFYPGGWAFPLY